MRYNDWADVLVGGNHLANYLIGKLGGDFSTKYPPTMPVEDASAVLDGDVFDVWCGWAAIMRARDRPRCGAVSTGEINET